MQGFFRFVFRGNVIGLAVGVVMGAAFSTVVQSFVAAFLTPLIGWAVGSSGNFANKQFHLGQTVFPYGAFIDAAIAFILVAACIYFLVVLPVNRLAAELNPHHDLSRAKRPCPECLTQIPAMATRCSACCAPSPPILDEDSDALAETMPGAISLRASSAAMSLKPPTFDPK
ncbi:MAG TPA: MscL family protein [Actinocrinis sp.]